VNVCVVNGPWQLIIVVAAMQSVEDQQACLVISLDPQEQHLGPVILSIAKKLRRWSGIEVVVRPKELVDSYELALKVVQKLPLVNHPTLWTVSLRHQTLQRAIAWLISPRNIQYYEDGIATVRMAREVSRGGRSIRGLISKATRGSTKFWRVLERPIVKSSLESLVDSVWLTEPVGKLVKTDPRLNRNTVSNEALHGVIGSLIKDLPDCNVPDGAVWLLGGNRSRWGSLTPSGEYQPIVDLVRSLIEKGYDIVWKPHPRADPLYAEYLSLKFNGRLTVLSSDAAYWPVEPLLIRYSACALMSLASTSLLYSKDILGISSFTLNDNKTSTKYSDIASRETASLIVSSVPHWTEFVLQV
jgi:hypothetical protein